MSVRHARTAVPSRPSRAAWPPLARVLWTAVGLAAACASLAGSPALAELPAAAVILLYQRVAEDANPSGSIRLDQLEAHLEELRSAAYAVLPLPRVVDGLLRGAAGPHSLPDRAVAITIDDAYRSAYDIAWPRLRAAGLPFTMFVSSDSVDRRAPGFLGWAEIREMAAAGVTIGSQTASYARLVMLPAEEAASEIDRGLARIEQMTGRRPTLFAYPYGEGRAPLKALLKARGIVAAFGQHSGVAHGRQDPLDGYPRFLLNEALGGIDRFRLVASALPLPVLDATPQDTLVTDGNPPAIGFTLDPELADAGPVSCFATQTGRTLVERMDDRIEVRLSQPFPPGRARINCTMPGPEGRWRWLGAQFVVP